MPDDTDQPAWLRLGVAAALSRAFAADQHAFLEMLARMLGAALPEDTVVKHRGGLFTKRTVRSVTVCLDEHHYTLQRPDRGPLRALRARVVRGIALKTEAVPANEWLAELGAALDERARANQATSEALAEALGLR